jgi:large subunit ribosomal protein L32|uniref:ribosomal protein L32 n=1 Tax=Cryptomonas gyropyrenoidosa TaxID=233257 RepID=UPI0027A57866|nr:ribosomal protein L32 [Cryptomonas gyropyrenoidosa]WFQ82916.1 ribosomal protein L32 [Cryptomonas gyropyrenoidosa]
MAVPKKRTSKSKKNSRLANWTRKADLEAKKALALAKSLLTGNQTSLISKIDLENFSKLN